MIPVRVTSPAELPVTLMEAKTALRVDHSEDDARIAGLLQAATDRFDGMAGILGRCLVTQTWRVDMPTFPYGNLWRGDDIARAGVWRFPLVPVQSVESVVYFDASNAEQVVDQALYSIATDPGGGQYLARAYGTAWPASVYSRHDAVRVTFVAGYGGAEAVPEPLRQAVIAWTRYLYDGKAEDARLADMKAAPYRRAGF